MASKIIFKTPYGERERVYVSSGTNGIEPVYGYEINKVGQKELVQTGETNLYKKIQSSLEETKIENILKRVAMGDDTVMRPDGIYADMTEAPKNLIEARQQMQQLENVWNGLSNEMKKKYDFSVEKFIGQSGTDEWLIDMGLLTKPAEETTSAEKKTEGAETE